MSLGDPKKHDFLITQNIFPLKVPIQEPLLASSDLMLVFRALSTSILSAVVETSLRVYSNSNPERNYFFTDMFHLSFNISEK
jgi:hypothetical protein